MDDALTAYADGRADGLAGNPDDTRANDPDYQIGLYDGQVEIFENNLLAAVRKALGEPEAA
ncbi:hypothetical protein [Catenuloplanes atrovinosus]|uniref:Uncharacterized protein n=1 Tax=Catenuloplanes atrovinosus TaxID=137266 RepID=A0AAE3YSJ6_9ACTN|nr:hypothetical protein [Catenuloplanes atrovinosus]MDR7277846.1 hypothetical protein [Catenuloplanes atrovinosus]